MHNDHLGTSSFVTDGDGDPTQFYLNFPFGETLYEQQNTNAYENPYKFNAKELDDETGLYYYGARYYEPRIGMWLSVDPLAEKFPAWSPYHYAYDNPVRFIDPDGRAPKPPDDHFDQYGRFLYTDNKKTNNIIINFVNPINGKISNAPWHSKIITDIDSSNPNNIEMLNNIALHYASNVGISKSDLIDGNFSTYNVFDLKYLGGKLEKWQSSSTNGGTHAMQLIDGVVVHPVMHISKNGNITIDLKEGKLNPLLGDKYNFMSVLQHEHNHQINPKDTELQTYYKQMKTSVFKRTNKEFKDHINQNIKHYEKNK